MKNSIRRLKLTEENAEIAAWYRMLGASLRNYVARFLHRREDVEEVVQEVFTRLTQQAEKKSGPFSRAYIFVIAANLVKDLLRQSARRKYAQHSSEELDSLRCQTSTPEETLISSQFTSRLLQAIEYLPEKNQVVFVLSKFESLSTAEIALKLDVSSRTVERRMKDAITLIHEYLKDDFR